MLSLENAHGNSLLIELLKHIPWMTVAFSIKEHRSQGQWSQIMTEIFLLSFYSVRVWQEKKEYQVSVGINSKGKVSLVPGLSMLYLGKGCYPQGHFHFHWWCCPDLLTGWRKIHSRKERHWFGSDTVLTHEAAIKCHVLYQIVEFKTGCLDYSFHSYVHSSIQQIFISCLLHVRFSAGYHHEALRKHEIQFREQASIKWGLSEGCHDSTVEWPAMKFFFFLNIFAVLWRVCSSAHHGV